MKHFAQLFIQLDQNAEPNSKLAALVEYFRVAEEKDKLWTIALLSQRRPKRMVTTDLLRTWATDLGGIPIWLFEESHKVAGDVAETIALVLPKATTTSAHNLTYWIDYIKDLEGNEASEKQAAVHAAWAQLDETECLVFNKIITGGFRLSVSQKLMTRALSKIIEVGEKQLAHRLLGDWTPDSTTFEELMLSASPSDDISMPYSFHLAHTLEDAPENLGAIGEWQVERKWDGIRGQLIVREGELFVWSRKEELLTDKFPEYHPLAKLLPNGTVLDGEILPYKKGEILTYNLLETRIKRKKLAKKMLLQTPIVFMVYDLLEYQGEDLRARPLSERRALLEQLLEIHDTQGIILLSDIVQAETWDDLVSVHANARHDKCGGLMLKRKTSTYQAGRKQGDWWKWKIDPLTIDAVLIYAQAGSGQRTKLFTEYTFALRDGDRLLPFTKASTGLTDKEYKEITAWVRQNTLEKFGPVRSVRPQHVFELAFDGIRTSTRHKSGVVLRAPRILRWRKDKTVGDANSLGELKGLLRKDD